MKILIIKNFQNYIIEYYKNYDYGEFKEYQKNNFDGFLEISKDIQAKIDSHEYDKIIYIFNTSFKHHLEFENSNNCEFKSVEWNLYNVVPINIEKFMTIIHNQTYPKDFNVNGTEFFIFKNQDSVIQRDNFIHLVEHLPNDTTFDICGLNYKNRINDLVQELKILNFTNINVC